MLVCDSASEVAALQYELLRGDPELAVDGVPDPFRAVEVAARTHPSAIVCDPSMEGGGGTEFVKRLLASSPSSAVVVRTSLLDPASIAGVLQAGARACLAKDDPAEDTIRAIRAAAGGGTVLSSATALLLSDGYLGALMRAEATEEELRDVRETVAAGTSAKADFLANISHELRTPVTVAKGIAYVLRNPAVPDEERDEFLVQLQGSLDSLIGIVDEIIAVAELERGTFELNVDEIDLAPLLRNAVDDVGRSYPVTIDAQIAEPLRVVADGGRIASVARELIDNACRYSPADRPVEVRARMLDEGVVVTVTDRGIGLDRAVASRSFDEPFTTGEATLRKEKAGIGVGLHLARQLIVEHGGILWADPLPGGGTRASFCIPVRAGERLAAPPAEVA